jgi:hypothetical protein
MANKTIIVTTQDAMRIRDQHNLENPKQEKKKVELLHEKLFNEYNIDASKLYDKNREKTKVLSKEWIKEIIERTADSTKIEMLAKTFNPQNNSWSFSIGVEEQCKDFHKKFNVNLFKNINDYITEKGENPTNYTRMLTFEITVGNGTVYIIF